MRQLALVTLKIGNIWKKAKWLPLNTHSNIKSWCNLIHDGQKTSFLQFLHSYIVRIYKDISTCQRTLLNHNFRFQYCSYSSSIYYNIYNIHVSNLTKIFMHIDMNFYFHTLTVTTATLIWIKIFGQITVCRSTNHH